MPAPLPSFVAALVCTGLAAWILRGALRARARRRLLEDLPATPAGFVFVGWVEVEGTAACDEPLAAPLSGTPCALFRLAVSERYRRVRVETTVDAKGRARTQTRVEEGWERIGLHAEAPPFRVVDDTGSVLVDPAGARLDLQSFARVEVERDDPQYTRFADSRTVEGSLGVRRLDEHGVAIGSDVHVVGRAQVPADAHEPVIAATDEDHGDQRGAESWFAIGTGGARAAERRAGSGSRSGLVFAWILTVGATFFLAGALGLALPTGGWRAGLAWVGAGTLVFGAMLAVPTVVGTYNRFVDLRERVERAASRCDVELDRRAQLLPRLVAIVSGMRDHEAELQADLAALRAQGAATREGLSGPDPRAVGGRLVALGERYPTLRSDELFRSLQERVVECEDRIAAAREYFNTVATSHRTALERWPASLLARAVGARPLPLLEATFERTPVPAEL